MKRAGPPLGLLVTKTVDSFFRDESRTAVAELLCNECGFGLPLASGEALVERIRLAVLKLADGNGDALLTWLAEAKRDWRDVLVAAGFAHDLASARAWASAL